MKKRSTVFFELEAQSNFLNNIACIDQMATSSSFTPSQSKLLKLKSNKNPTDKGISVEDFNFDSKKYGDEFNQSKYVIKKKPKNPVNDRLSNQDSSPLLKKPNLVKLSIKTKEINKKSFLLNKIDEDMVDCEVFENNITNIMKNHIKYQVKIFVIFLF